MSANGPHYANGEAVGGRRRGNTAPWMQDEDGKVHFSEPWIIPPQNTGRLHVANSGTFPSS